MRLAWATRFNPACPTQSDAVSKPNYLKLGIVTHDYDPGIWRLRKNDHEFERKVDSTVSLGPAEEALS